MCAFRASVPSRTPRTGARILVAVIGPTVHFYGSCFPQYISAWTTIAVAVRSKTELRAIVVPFGRRTVLLYIHAPIGNQRLLIIRFKLLIILHAGKSGIRFYFSVSFPRDPTAALNRFRQRRRII